MNKIFEYYTTVTIGDTNLLQNMYFANFFKLQGIIRELFVKDVVEDGLESLRNGLVLITKSASCDYKKDFYLYDKILVQLQFTEIGRASTNLAFKFFKKDTMELCAEGEQKVVFATQDHKVCRIPENFRKAIIEYCA